MPLGQSSSMNDVVNAVNDGAEKFGTVKRQGAAQQIVVSRPDGTRQLVSAETSMDVLKQVGVVVELWDEPLVSRCVLVIDRQEFEQDVLLDFNVDLGQMVAVVQNAFKARLQNATPIVFSVRSTNADEPGSERDIRRQRNNTFFFQSCRLRFVLVFETGFFSERWLKLNMPLNQQRIIGGSRIVARRVVDLTTPPALTVGGALGAGGSFNGDNGAMTPGEARQSFAPRFQHRRAVIFNNQTKNSTTHTALPTLLMRRFIVPRWAFNHVGPRDRSCRFSKNYGAS